MPLIDVPGKTAMGIYTIFRHAHVEMMVNVGVAISQWRQVDDFMQVSAW